MMADTVIYGLARSARSKLSMEASNGDWDLRRIVGHANVLDHLTAELVQFGYGWNNDDAVVAENDELVTPPSRMCWTSQEGTDGIDDAYGSEPTESSEIESSEMESSESAEPSDQSDRCSDSDSESDSAESWEGEGEGNYYDGGYVEYVDLSKVAQISKAHSPEAAIQVSVCEINEFD
jgi:hypothetical protein